MSFFFDDVANQLTDKGSALDRLLHPAPPQESTPHEQMVGNLMPAAIAQVREDSAAPTQSTPDFTQAMPFQELIVDLNSSAYQTNDGVRINVQGYGLAVRKFGSSPLARLNIKAAGTFLDLYPGSRLKASFDYFNVKVTNGQNTGTLGGGGVVTSYPTAGYAIARLLILKDPLADYLEPDTIPGAKFAPVDITPGACVWDTAYTNALACVVGTYPTLTTGLLNVAGWKRIRVFASTGTKTFTSIDVLPITTSLGDTFADSLNRYQPLENFSISPPSTGTYQTFVFEYDVEGIEKIGFFFNNPAGGTLAAADTCNLLVSGIL